MPRTRLSAIAALLGCKKRTDSPAAMPKLCQSSARRGLSCRTTTDFASGEKTAPWPPLTAAPVGRARASPAAKSVASAPASGANRNVRMRPSVLGSPHTGPARALLYFSPNRLSENPLRKPTCGCLRPKVAKYRPERLNFCDIQSAARSRGSPCFTANRGAARLTACGAECGQFVTVNSAKRAGKCMAIAWN